MWIILKYFDIMQEIFILNNYFKFVLKKNTQLKYISYVKSNEYFK